MPLVATATAFMLVTTLLDGLEKHSFLSSVAAAGLDSLPFVTDTHWRVLPSTVKFHVIHLGLRVLGLALPRTTGTELALA